MTEYRRASSSHDYKLAHQLMRAEKIPEDTLGFPTNIAVRPPPGLYGSRIVCQI
jgi:hypothetical protein